eukprot:53782_1
MMTDCKINVFKAVERGNCRKLKEFLESGGGKAIRKTDPKFNATLLHWAALRNQVDCVEICIRAGADLEAKTNTNGTPLMWACMEGSSRAVTTLLRRGADVNSVTTSLATPMHHAASYGHAEVVSILLAHGANPTVEDVYGNRPGDNFFNDVTEDFRRKVAQELEGARERSSTNVRPPNKVKLGSRVRRDEVEEVHSCTVGGGECGKSKKKHDSSLLRALSPSDATVNINDLIHSLDETKAVEKTVFEELKESEAAVVAAIAARKNCGEKHHAAVEAVEAATLAFALALYSKEQRLMCLESDFKSREIELKNALESKENEKDELKYRSEGVSGTMDSIWSLSSQERMDVSHMEYSKKGYNAVAGDDREKNDKNSQVEELEIPLYGHLPEATAIRGIPTPTRTLSSYEQRPSVQEEQDEQGYLHDIVRSSPAPVIDDASTVEDQSLTGWQSNKDDISEIPYLYSLLAAGK